MKTMRIAWGLALFLVIGCHDPSGLGPCTDAACADACEAAGQSSGSCHGDLCVCQDGDDDDTEPPLEGNVSIRILHAIPNYRAPIDICLFEESAYGGTLLTPQPFGRESHPDGIPYGEVTEYIELTLQGPGMVSTCHLVHGDRACPATGDECYESEEHLYSSGAHLDPAQRHWLLTSGGYMPPPIGELWSVCGDDHDEPCDDPMLYGAVQACLQEITDVQAEPEQTLARGYVHLANLMLDRHVAHHTTLCWDPDGDGPTPPELVQDLSYHASPVALAPMVTGVIQAHEHLDDAPAIDCPTADISDAFATLELPAPAPFGTAEMPGTLADFGPGSSGILVLIGVKGEGLPEEAAPEFIPLAVPTL